MTLTAVELAESYRRRGQAISSAKRGVVTTAMLEANAITGERARQRPRKKCVSDCACAKHRSTPGRYRHPKGYVVLTGMVHPLTLKPPGVSGNLLEHRYVLWNKLGCESLDCTHPCHWCAIPLRWDALKADHVDAVKDNNDPENVVPACNSCNIKRGKAAKA